MNVKLEVRCCCRPETLFGFLNVPIEDAMRGRSNAKHIHEGEAGLKIERYNASFRLSGIMLARIQDPAVRARFERRGLFEGGVYEDEYLAVVSDEKPLEWWRDLVGFEEATPEQRQLASLRGREAWVLQSTGVIPSSPAERRLNEPF